MLLIHFCFIYMYMLVTLQLFLLIILPLLAGRLLRSVTTVYQQYISQRSLWFLCARYCTIPLPHIILETEKKKLKQESVVWLTQDCFDYSSFGVSSFRLNSPEYFSKIILCFIHLLIHLLIIACFIFKIYIVIDKWAVFDL